MKEKIKKFDNSKILTDANNRFPNDSKKNIVILTTVI